MSDMTLRSIGSDEHNVLLNILDESLGQFLDQPGTKNLISSDASILMVAFLPERRAQILDV